MRMMVTPMLYIWKCKKKFFLRIQRPKKKIMMGDKNVQLNDNENRRFQGLVNALTQYLREKIIVSYACIKRFKN